MNKKNTTKPNKAIAETVELTEEQLKAKAAELLAKREESCKNEINAILKKYKCGIVPNIDVRLNGQPVVSVIKAL